MPELWIDNNYIRRITEEEYKSAQSLLDGRHHIVPDGDRLHGYSYSPDVAYYADAPVCSDAGRALLNGNRNPIKGIPVDAIVPNPFLAVPDSQRTFHLMVRAYVVGASWTTDRNLSLTVRPTEIIGHTFEDQFIRCDPARLDITAHTGTDELGTLIEWMTEHGHTPDPRLACRPLHVIQEIRATTDDFLLVSRDKTWATGRMLGF